MTFISFNIPGSLDTSSHSNLVLNMSTQLPHGKLLGDRLDAPWHLWQLITRTKWNQEPRKASIIGASPYTYFFLISYWPISPPWKMKSLHLCPQNGFTKKSCNCPPWPRHWPTSHRIHTKPQVTKLNQTNQIPCRSFDLLPTSTLGLLRQLFSLRNSEKTGCFCCFLTLRRLTLQKS